jgi:hypothetical protein
VDYLNTDDQPRVQCGCPVRGGAVKIWATGRDRWRRQRA